MDKDNK
ncbi:4752a98e-cd91-4c59-9f78-dce76455d147 [Thermothielavioides terrestris]|nr:4752a98e-cd91-4c59-9f78-dce76455d147 [Thermothielavioides terrestris]